MNELDRLAEYAANLRFPDLPPAVIERARWVLRDTVGAILGGMAEPEVTRLAAYAATKAPGFITLAGFDRATTTEYAVFVHGTAGVSLEMDEGHAFAQGHAAEGEGVHRVHPVEKGLHEAGETQSGSQAHHHADPGQ